MANVSLVTGKTWDQMNQAEKLAHTLARGTADPAQAQNNPLYAQAQQILQQTGYADQQRQQALRDEAIDRIAAGQGQVALTDAIQAGGYQNYQDYATRGGLTQATQGMLTGVPTFGFQAQPQAAQSTEGMFFISDFNEKGQPDASYNITEGRYVTEEELKEVWDTNGNLRKQFNNDFNAYQNFLMENEDLLKEGSFNAQTQNTVVPDRASTGSVANIGTNVQNVLNQADATQARMAEWEQWIETPQAQQLMEAGGFEPVIYNDDGDMFIFTGAGYEKVQEVDDTFGVDDVIDLTGAALTNYVVGNIGGGILGDVGSAVDGGFTTNVTEPIVNTVNTVSDVLNPTTTADTITDLYSGLFNFGTQNQYSDPYSDLEEDQTVTVRPDYEPVPPNPSDVDYSDTYADYILGNLDELINEQVDQNQTPPEVTPTTDIVLDTNTDFPIVINPDTGQIVVGVPQPPQDEEGGGSAPAGSGGSPAPEGSPGDFVVMDDIFKDTTEEDTTKEDKPEWVYEGDGVWRYPTTDEYVIVDDTETEVGATATIEDLMDQYGDDGVIDSGTGEVPTTEPTEEESGSVTVTVPETDTKDSGATDSGTDGTDGEGDSGDGEGDTGDQTGTSNGPDKCWPWAGVAAPPGYSSEACGGGGSGTGTGTGDGAGDGDGEGDGDNNGSSAPASMFAAAREFTPFMAGISYNPLQIPELIQTRPVDSMSALNQIIERSLFRDMI